MNGNQASNAAGDAGAACLFRIGLQAMVIFRNAGSNDPSLAGFAFFSQAIQFGHPPFVLSNAQDFTVGGS